jgi:hypothetical protein
MLTARWTIVEVVLHLVRDLLRNGAVMAKDQILL